MTQLIGWKRKFVLIFKSEKRLGAKQIFSNFTAKTYEQMKHTLITEEDVDLTILSDKVRIKDLSGHLNKLKKEFIGQSELNFYHATLIVLLRRGYKPLDVFAEFEKLWESEYEYLLSNLTVRWIVSACDTFIDHSLNPIRPAILLNVVTLVNTLKVYETEKFLKTDTDNRSLNKNNVVALYEKQMTLYDGLTYFRIGTDDTLKHMRERYQSFNDKDELATRILLYIFDRVQTSSSAFATLKELHKDEKSQWW